MIAKLMALSVRARWAVLFLFLVIAGLGVWQLTKLPIDAVPDITNKQVQINTIDPRLSPVEIENLKKEKLLLKDQLYAILKKAAAEQ